MRITDPLRRGRRGRQKQCAEPTHVCRGNAISVRAADDHRQWWWRRRGHPHGPRWIGVLVTILEARLCLVVFVRSRICKQDDHDIGPGRVEGGRAGHSSFWVANLRDKKSYLCVD